METSDKNKMISLKEAAQISGYSADYIGQLIRAGKITGKQVYTNVSWMTTADAVIEYKNRSKSSETLGDKVTQRGRRLAMEINIIKLFFATFRYALPLLIMIVVSFLLLIFYIFSLISDNKPIDIPLDAPEEQFIEF